MWRRAELKVATYRAGPPAPLLPTAQQREEERLQDPREEGRRGASGLASLPAPFRSRPQPKELPPGTVSRGERGSASPVPPGRQTRGTSTSPKSVTANPRCPPSPPGCTPGLKEGTLPGRTEAGHSCPRGNPYKRGAAAAWAAGQSRVEAEVPVEAPSSQASFHPYNPKPHKTHRAAPGRDLAQRGGRQAGAASLPSPEALKPWNIHALAKRQLQRDLKCT